MILETKKAPKIDRKSLIQSYGFVEQLSANKLFLKESLDLAIKISGAKIAYISLLDDEHQYILSSQGMELKTIKVEDSICQYTIKSDEVLAIEDTRNNEFTACLPQVKKENGIVFYAGGPLLNSDNEKIGALCVMDTKTISFSQLQKDTLRVLAKQVMTTLDGQRGMIKLIKNINSNFKPAACADLNCLQGELSHLQNEVVAQNQLIKDQKVNLEIANEELVNFANMVAHDVRAPLRTIRSFITLHEKELEKSPFTFKQEYLTFIKQAATNLNDLTTKLLEYAKSNNDSFNDETISLKKVLDTVALHLTDSIKSSNAKINLPEDDFFIKAKRLQMIQLFQNLISNAIKYQKGEEVPQITIQAVEAGKKVRISIIDNGIGISKENLQKIFEPFVRLHTAIEYNGSGIGLAMCKKIVNRLDAEFIVTSELGKGSIFTFELPRDIGNDAP